MSVRAADDGVVLVGFARTPFGRFGPRYGQLRIATLGAAAVHAALEAFSLSPDVVDETIFGVNFPGIDRTVARQVALRVGIPESTPTLTIDRACCSSLTAAGLAAMSLRTGSASVVVAGGVENHSGVPHALAGMRFGGRLGAGEIKDPLIVSDPISGTPRAVQAGEEAVSFGVTREQQDEWAAQSHAKYAVALEQGRVVGLAPVDLIDEGGAVVKMDHDECFRADASVDQMSKLPTVYGSPSVTAGNAPNLATGASALVWTTRDRARRGGWKELATLRLAVGSAGPPERVASIPGHTAKLALARAGLDLDDMAVIEINEAFAAVPLVSARVLAGSDSERLRSIEQRLNADGGAIAIGHPTAATGARLVMNTVGQLRRRGGGIGLISICGGSGEAEAAIIEVR